MRDGRMVLAVLLCALCFVGCSSAARSAKEILDEELAASGALPAGETYYFAVGKNDTRPLSDGLFFDLFGHEGEVCLPMIEEYAVYLSSSEPCEIAVLRCYAGSDTDEVARMCLARSERMRAVLRHTAYYERAEKGEISVLGRDVIWRMTP